MTSQREEWLNTDGMIMAEMKTVSDKYTLAKSKGEVKKIEDLTNEKIFGKISTDNKTALRTGHIHLYAPVVNVQYFKGRFPKLSSCLGLSIKEMEDIIYSTKYIVIDPGNINLCYKQLLTEQEYEEERVNYNDKFRAMTGAKAIEKLLEMDNIPEAQYMVLHNIPVVPIDMRYTLGIDKLYKDVIKRNTMLKRILELGVHDVSIRRETRLLQVAVDRLINNGAAGNIFVDCNSPVESLEELYQYITQKETKKRFPDIKISSEDFLDRVISYWKYYYEEKDNTISEEDEDEIPEDYNPGLGELSRRENDIKNMFYEYIKAYIQLNYDRYERFTDMIFCDLSFDVPNKNPEEIPEMVGKETKDAMETIIENIKFGLAKQVDFYIKKALKWSYL